MSESFKEGDVVRLKSGGPKMTVTHVDASRICSCAWFSGAAVHRSEFFAGALKLDDGRSDTSFIV